MNCPKCQHEMHPGELRLHRSHSASLMFSPKDEPPHGILSWLSPAFTQPVGDQKEVMFDSQFFMERYTSHDGAYFCKSCSVLVVENV